MPVEVNWGVMDTGLLARFWSGHPQLRRGTAELLERILVFHRGVHTVSPHTLQPSQTLLTNLPARLQLPLAESPVSMDTASQCEQLAKVRCVTQLLCFLGCCSHVELYTTMLQASISLSMENLGMQSRGVQAWLSSC